MKSDHAAWLPEVKRIAEAAGAAIMAIYTQAQPEVHIKADHSPVTNADLAAHTIIVDALTALTPAIPVLSEESATISWQERQSWQRYWLVDPLDGTREFIKGNDEFTVNIALIEQHVAVMGVVQAPVSGDLYHALAGAGAHLCRDGRTRRLATRPAHRPLTVMMSRSHRREKQEALLAELEPYTILSRGSSLKFCLLAAAEADVYVRPGPTSEWDTAAAQCILEAAGGAVTTFAGESLRYNTKDSLLNPEFIAVGDAQAALHRHLCL